MLSTKHKLEEFRRAALIMLLTAAMASSGSCLVFVKTFTPSSKLPMLFDAHLHTVPGAELTSCRACESRLAGVTGAAGLHTSRLRQQEWSTCGSRPTR